MDFAVEAGGDAAPVLDAAEHSFDDVALLVDRFVVVVLDFAVFTRRDDGLGSALAQPFAQGLAVIAFVGNQFGRGWHRLDALLRDLAIMGVSRGQEQDEGPALVVADSMELGVTAPFGAADTIGQGPPFAPPAQR